MAKTYGTLQGMKGIASRRGDKEITAHLKTYKTDTKVVLREDDRVEINLFSLDGNSHQELYINGVPIDPSIYGGVPRKVE